MNQTYQSSRYSHAGQYSNIGPSNLKIFHGEDLTYGDRKRLQQLQQMDWIQQQTRQKEEMKQNQVNEKRQFDELTRTINMMRNELEKEKADRLRGMEVACQNINKQLLEDKLGRQKYYRDRETEEKLNHIDYVTGNDFYTQNPATCQSMLGRNRVINYHWKGMNDDQRKNILLEQQRQRREKQLQKQLEEEQNKLFALQEQANRKALIRADEAKNSGLKNIRKGVDQYNLLKAEQMKRKVYHAYDELHTFKNE